MVRLPHGAIALFFRVRNVHAGMAVYNPAPGPLGFRLGHNVDVLDAEIGNRNQKSRGRAADSPQEKMIPMQRRDFVKAIMAAATAAAAPVALEAQQQQPPAAPSAPTPNLKPNVTQAPQAPGPVPWMRGLDEVRALPIVPIAIDAVGETETQFFSNTQAATLKRLAELFQPAFKKYPSAVDAGAPEFLDFLIGASPVERQHLYQVGLDRLDREAHQKFGVAFAATDAGQADQLIRPWLRTWMGELPPTEPHARFINVVHLDLRTATINSQAWAEV